MKSNKHDCLSVDGKSLVCVIMLMWPWPWPHDLDARPWTRCSTDVHM